MTHSKEEMQRIAEWNSTFMMLTDKGKDSALTILRTLSFAQTVLGGDAYTISQLKAQYRHRAGILD